VKVRTRRIVFFAGALVAGVIALNLLANGLDRAVGGNEPGGVTGSSYATGAQGLAAYATLLTDYDHSVSQQRGSLADNPPAPDETMVVIEPSVLTEADTDTLLQFVAAGGRLVVGGQNPYYIRRLRDQAPSWAPTGRTEWTEIGPGLGAVRTVATAAEGSFVDPGSSEVVVGDNQRSLLTRERVGAGEILYLADPSAIENDYLAQADNAAFGLALAGEPARPVVFAEGVHGYGESRGFAAIPTRWKWALGILAVAALAYIWSRARRFGPPDRVARELPPARAEYVRALSTTLERTRDPVHSLEPVRQFTRTRIAAQAALAPNPTDDDIVRAARALGCPDDEIAALLRPPADQAETLALGRALARVGERDNRRVE
jgi:hypothetical protein